MSFVGHLVARARSSFSERAPRVARPPWRGSARSAPVILALFLVASPRLARASDAAAAGELFDQAKALMTDGKTAEACTKFQASLDLDPTLGTTLNLADCYEKLGRVASAYRLFSDGNKMAVSANDDRAGFAADRRDALKPRVPRLVLDVVQGPADVTVKLRGKTVEPSDYGVAQLVDPGEVEVTVVRKQVENLESRKVTVAESKEAHLALDLVAIDKAHPRPRALVTDEPDPAQRIAGFVIGGVGVLGLAAFTALEVSALVIRGEADEPGFCVNDACSPDGIEKVETAGTLAETGQWIGVGGVGLAAIGLTLLLTAPSAPDEPDAAAVVVVPTGPLGTPGLTVGGRF